jgi:hypothetical protein
MDIARDAAKEIKLELFEGFYSWCSGPNYETISDTTILRKFGAGSFGMSTVPEVLAAGQVGMECVVFSLCTNLAAGLQSKLTHSEVEEEAKKSGPILQNFVATIIKKIDPNHNKGNPKSLVHDCFTDHNIESYSFKTIMPSDTIESDIESAVGQIRFANLPYEKVHEVFWFMSKGAWSGILNGEGDHALVDVRELSYTELTGNRCKTSSAKHTEIVIGTTRSGKRVLAIANAFLDGMNPVEAHYTTKLIQALGIGHVKFIFEVCNSNGQFADDSLVCVDDFFTKVYHPPVEINNDYFYPYRHV